VGARTRFYPSDPRHQPFDLVITVCDEAAGESCPIFPGTPKKIHWSTPDPAWSRGRKSEKEAAFDHAFFLLRQQIEGLVSNVFWCRIGVPLSAG
jgi:arsenate reductase